jgi:hypothetical protein
MKLKPVRIGLWDQYGGSMPSGWTRWLFEQYEFPFEVVYPATLDAGNLNAKFDVLVFVDGGIPERDGGAGGGGGGFGGQPPADTLPAEFRGWLGRVTVSKTVPEIRKFVENGGTVLTIGSSTALGRHLGLPIRDALVERVAGGAERPLPREKYYITGSILEARIDNTLPLAYGMDQRAMVLRSRSSRDRSGGDTSCSSATKSTGAASRTAPSSCSSTAFTTAAPRRRLGERERLTSRNRLQIADFQSGLQTADCRFRSASELIRISNLQSANLQSAI